MSDISDPSRASRRSAAGRNQAALALTVGAAILVVAIALLRPPVGGAEPSPTAEPSSLAAGTSAAATPVPSPGTTSPGATSPGATSPVALSTIAATTAASSAPTQEPTPTPTPSALPSPSPRELEALLTVEGCDFAWVDSTYADGKLYTACPTGDNELVGAIDVATGKVTNRYDVQNHAYSFGLDVAGGALWVNHPTTASACAGWPCDLNWIVKRIDLKSGRITSVLKDRLLVGVVGSYVLVAHENGFGPIVTSIDPAVGLEKVDLVSGRVVGRLRWRWTECIVGAGHLWGYDRPEDRAATTRLVEVDPASGKEIASFDIPGDPGAVFTLDGRRWVRAWGEGTIQRFVELGVKGADRVSPDFSETASPLGLAGAVFVSGSAFYEMTDESTLAKLDPSTWDIATTWRIPKAEALLIAGDTLWIVVSNEAGNYSMERLDLQV